MTLNSNDENEFKVQKKEEPKHAGAVDSSKQGPTLIPEALPRSQPTENKHHSHHSHNPHLHRHHHHHHRQEQEQPDDSSHTLIMKPILQRSHSHADHHGQKHRQRASKHHRKSVSSSNLPETAGLSRTQSLLLPSSPLTHENSSHSLNKLANSYCIQMSKGSKPQTRGDSASRPRLVDLVHEHEDSPTSPKSVHPSMSSSFSSSQSSSWSSVSSTVSSSTSSSGSKKSVARRPSKPTTQALAPSSKGSEHLFTKYALDYERSGSRMLGRHDPVVHAQPQPTSSASPPSTPSFITSSTSPTLITSPASTASQTVTASPSNTTRRIVPEKMHVASSFKRGRKTAMSSDDHSDATKSKPPASPTMPAISSLTTPSTPRTSTDDPRLRDLFRHAYHQISSTSPSISAPDSPMSNPHSERTLISTPPSLPNNDMSRHSQISQASLDGPAPSSSIAPAPTPLQTPEVRSLSSPSTPTSPSSPSTSTYVKSQQAAKFANLLLNFKLATDLASPSAADVRHTISGSGGTSALHARPQSKLSPNSITISPSVNMSGANHGTNMSSTVTAGGGGNYYANERVIVTNDESQLRQQLSNQASQQQLLVQQIQQVQNQNNNSNTNGNTDNDSNHRTIFSVLDNLASYDSSNPGSPTQESPHSPFAPLNAQFSGNSNNSNNSPSNRGTNRAGIHHHGPSVKIKYDSNNVMDRVALRQHIDLGTLDQHFSSEDPLLQTRSLEEQQPTDIYTQPTGGSYNNSTAAIVTGGRQHQPGPGSFSSSLSGINQIINASNGSSQASPNISTSNQQLAPTPIIYVSPETLLRAQKAKATLELKYDVICCFQGATTWLGQDREPPRTDTGELIFTKYNPLQTIRNRPLRLRDGFNRSRNGQPTDVNESNAVNTPYDSRRGSVATGISVGNDSHDFGHHSHSYSRHSGIPVNPFSGVGHNGSGSSGNGSMSPRLNSSTGNLETAKKLQPPFVWKVDIYELFSDLNWRVVQYALMRDRFGKPLFHSRYNNSSYSRPVTAGSSGQQLLGYEASPTKATTSEIETNEGHLVLPDVVANRNDQSDANSGKRLHLLTHIGLQHHNQETNKPAGPVHLTSAQEDSAFRDQISKLNQELDVSPLPTQHNVYIHQHDSGNTSSDNSYLLPSSGETNSSNGTSAFEKLPVSLMSNSANTSLTTTPPMLLTSGNGSGLSINKPVLVKIQDKLSDKLKSIASSNSHNMGSDSEDGKLESDGSMHRVSLVPSESAVLAETQQKFNGHSETPTVLLPHPSIPNNKDDFSHPYTNSSPNLNAINTRANTMPGGSASHNSGIIDPETPSTRRSSTTTPSILPGLSTLSNNISNLPKISSLSNLSKDISNSLPNIPGFTGDSPKEVKSDTTKRSINPLSHLKRKSVVVGSWADNTNVNHMEGTHITSDGTEKSLSTLQKNPMPDAFLSNSSANTQSGETMPNISPMDVSIESIKGKYHRFNSKPGDSITETETLIEPLAPVILVNDNVLETPDASNESNSATVAEAGLIDPNQSEGDSLLKPTSETNGPNHNSANGKSDDIEPEFVDALQGHAPSNNIAATNFKRRASRPGPGFLAEQAADSSTSAIAAGQLLDRSSLSVAHTRAEHRTIIDRQRYRIIASYALELRFLELVHFIRFISINNIMEHFLNGGSPSKFWKNSGKYGMVCPLGGPGWPESDEAFRANGKEKIQELSDVKEEYESDGSQNVNDRKSRTASTSEEPDTLYVPTTDVGVSKSDSVSSVFSFFSSSSRSGAMPRSDNNGKAPSISVDKNLNIKGKKSDDLSTISASTLHPDTMHSRSTKNISLLTSSISTNNNTQTLQILPALQQKKVVRRLASEILDTAYSSRHEVDRVRAMLHSYTSEISTLRRTRISTTSTRLDNLLMSSDQTLNRLATTLNLEVKKATERMDHLERRTRRYGTSAIWAMLLGDNYLNDYAACRRGRPRASASLVGDADIGSSLYGSYYASSGVLPRIGYAVLEYTLVMMMWFIWGFASILFGAKNIAFTIFSCIKWLFKLFVW